MIVAIKAVFASFHVSRVFPHRLAVREDCSGFVSAHGVRRLRDPRMSEHILTRKHQAHEHHTHPHAAFGWRIHCGVEVTELSTNKQHTHRTAAAAGDPRCCQRTRLLRCASTSKRMRTASKNADAVVEARGGVTLELSLHSGRASYR